MLKAIMKAQVSVTEISEDGVDNDIVVFEEGMEVEIIRELSPKYGYRQFIIFSEELNESTVVYEGLLSNIDIHLQ